MFHTFPINVHNIKLMFDNLKAGKSIVKTGFSYRALNGGLEESSGQSSHLNLIHFVGFPFYCHNLTEWNNIGQI